MRFYRQEDLNNINKKKKSSLIFVIAFAVTFVITLLVFVIISTYKTRLLFSIISSVIEIIIVIFEIYFIGKYLYLRRISNEYATLLNAKDEIIRCEILSCSDFFTTLPDRSRCYEVLVKKEDEESIYYLSEIFNRDDIKPGICEVAVSSDYIKGVKYED